tara:strand:+ start:10152 stop:10604 length:453 start_codon:yes stop_codon:yes gene_type:complete
MTEITFGTVTVERETGATAEWVFAAFADASQREKWGAPSDTAAFIVEQDEFEEGGTDLTRCGSRDDPSILVTTRYHVIEAPHLIIHTETVSDGGNTLASILTTIEIDNSGGLRITAQVASLVGQEMIDNTERGQNGSADSLVRYLKETTE